MTTDKHCEQYATDCAQNETAGAVKRVVILGGGTAGWLTAGVLAAEHCSNSADGVHITLIESPDVQPIGVGEGTWPSMRNTLRKMGVSETDLFRECEASFKQGAQFCGWVNGQPTDSYYHPLVIPNGYGEIDLAGHWQSVRSEISFAEAISFQAQLCDAGRAPKQLTTPEYAAVANYAYHLNSGKLGEFLKRHCMEKLGVNYLRDNVVSVNARACGDIASLQTERQGAVAGDLFVDCSGAKALLIGDYCKVPFVDCSQQLFNDAALAVHAPYAQADAPIASHTLSTAHAAGWIWDIGLPSRRGVGVVYSQAHASEAQAESALRDYLARSMSRSQAAALEYRKLTFRPGHRAYFWHRNCVAIGMSAGFIEPLEASALVLVELSAAMLSEDLPTCRAAMDTVAKRFNQRFQYRWASIIDFLKLHYVLSQRTDSVYWRDNCDAASQSDRLQAWLQLWRYQPPCRFDFPQVEEVFASASWQYVLYGMGYSTQTSASRRRNWQPERFNQLVQDNREFADRARAALPSNRELIEKIIAFGLQKV